MIGLDLILACAPHVAPATIQAIIQVESSGNPLAVQANPRTIHGRKVFYGSPPPIRTAQDAATFAYGAMDSGHSVDLGLMQVNSRNLPALGLSVKEVLDPCTNIRAGAQILSDFYAGALKQYPAGEPALRAALSAYNTGDYQKGFANGYVARYSKDLPSPPSLPDLDSKTLDTLIFEARADQEGATDPSASNELQAAQADPLLVAMPLRHKAKQTASPPPEQDALLLYAAAQEPASRDLAKEPVNPSNSGATSD